MQLQLTPKQLRDIGFKRRRYGATYVYEITFLNSVIYYNPKEAVFKWYLRTTVGEYGNGVHLDIQTAPHLFALLQSLRVKFTQIIL
jgi:hypothetical protein